MLATTYGPKTKLNRWQKLLTAEQARKIPALYAQDGAGLNATAYVKFFCGGFTWFASEFDAKTGEFFGLVISPACPDGELGYFSAADLCRRQEPSARLLGGNRFTIAPVVERDLHFKPQSLLAAYREFTGKDHPSAPVAGAVCKCGCDKAAVEFDAAGQPVCDRHSDEF